MSKLIYIQGYNIVIDKICYWWWYKDELNIAFEGSEDAILDFCFSNKEEADRIDSELRAAFGYT